MNTIKELHDQIQSSLQDGIIPFWLDRALDTVEGGYLTSFDQHGQFYGDGTKNIVTQSRMVWGFSALLPYARDKDKERMREAAYHGACYLRDTFWDPTYEGFYWLLNRDGSVKDGAKLTYGQGFAIYALTAFYLAYQEEWALELASRGFVLLQSYAADTFNGGYYENIERDWSLSPAGAYAGERKSLDIHMHLLETFTLLAEATGKEIHTRKLQEVWNLINTHMVDAEKGYAYNQFDSAFTRIPAINIKRTWNDERESNEESSPLLDTTSFGHNVELSWLADYALETIGERRPEDDELLARLLDHSLALGVDKEYGGVFRDGIADQEVVVFDKEWWQNFESMVGFINGYYRYGKQEYLEAFISIWTFIKDNFLSKEFKESYQLLNRKGEVLISNLGNDWKGMYHTGRSLAESLKRLQHIMDKEDKWS